MNIDSHQHFWRYDPVRDRWITPEMSRIRRDFLPEDLLPELRHNQIDGCVAVQADQSEAETFFLLDLAAKHDEIKGVVGWVDLSASNISDRLEYFSQFERLRGFRHIAQSEPDDRFLVRKEFVAGLQCLQHFGFSYDILIYPRQLPAALELVEKLPDQRFVIDHLAKPSIRSGELSPWAEQIRAIAANPNIYCKLSGLVTEADWKHWRQADFEPYLDVTFEAFGPDRVMFGSDWPVCLLAGSYQQVKNVLANHIDRLPHAQRQKIFGLNAISCYALKASTHESAPAK